MKKDPTNELLNQTMKALLDKIPRDYMSEMCKGLYDQSPAQTVTTDDVTVNVIRTEINERDETFYFDSTKSTKVGSSTVCIL